jgi:hypothetical protein
VIPARIAALGVAALLIGGTGLGVAATRDSDDDTVTAAPGVSEEPTTTTSTTELPVSTTTTTTAAPTSSTTATTVRRTTTTARATTTTRAPATTTTTAGRPATCTPAQMELTAVSDKPTYGPSEPALVTAKLRNKSSTPCSHTGYTVDIAFRDASGMQWRGASVVADTIGDVSVKAGESFTHSGSWDHLFHPPGPATATVTWKFAGNTYTATLPFQLT